MNEYELFPKFKGTTVTVEGIKLDFDFFASKRVEQTLELFPAIKNFVRKKPTKKTK